MASIVIIKSKLLLLPSLPGAKDGEPSFSLAREVPEQLGPMPQAQVANAVVGDLTTWGDISVASFGSKGR